MRCCANETGHTVARQRKREKGSCRTTFLQWEVGNWLKDTWSPGKTQCLRLSIYDSQRKKRNSYTGGATQMEAWLSRWQSLTSHFHTLWNLIRIFFWIYVQFSESAHYLAFFGMSFTECTVLTLDWNIVKYKENLKSLLFFLPNIKLPQYRPRVHIFSFASAASFLSHIRHHVTCLTKKGGLE